MTSQRVMLLPLLVLFPKSKTMSADMVQKRSLLLVGKYFKGQIFIVWVWVGVGDVSALRAAESSEAGQWKLAVPEKMASKALLQQPLNVVLMILWGKKIIGVASWKKSIISKNRAGHC